MQSVGWLYDEKMRSVKPRTLFHVINECAQTELMSHSVNDSMPRLFHRGQLLPPFNHIFPMHTQIHTFFYHLLLVLFSLSLFDLKLMSDNFCIHCFWWLRSKKCSLSNCSASKALISAREYCFKRFLFIFF